MFTCLFGHKWKIVLAKTFNYVYANGNKGGTVTKVINKCTECGKREIGEYDGSWTLDELMGTEQP